MSDPEKPASSDAQPPPRSEETSQEQFAALRREMLEKQLRARGIRDPRVLSAMLAVSRHAFVLPESLAHAYDDQPLSIGEGQTISQPFMVAAMSEALELGGGERVLEIGTGSGYQTGILSLLAREVFTVETHSALAAAAHERLERLGYRNVQIRIGDGTLGWPEDAPFDAILVTAAAPMIPPPLIQQLAEGGRLVIPAGSAETQQLTRLRCRTGELSSERLFDCRFVPLVGKYGWSHEDS
jgi:protein-L-isoaspartate(D-aspartate) O-methyltransferase